MAWRGRYLLLMFDCLLVVGIYFCTDIPSALQSQIEGTQTNNCTVTANSTCCEDCLGLGAEKYNLLFTIYSWTSSAMILPVGVVIDRIGNRVSALVFTGIATSGSLVFAIGALPSVRGTSYMFPIMMCGRLLLGAGTGSSRIVRDRVIACWFPDKLALAFGIAISTMGMGSVLTFLLTSNMAQWIGLGPTLFVGVGVCSTCFLSAICLCVLDWYGSKQANADVITLKEVSVPNLSTIKKFPKSFWIICIMIATYYSFQLSFTANGSKFIQEKYGYKKTSSSYINGAVYDVSVVLSPLFGFILDKVGNRGLFACLGALLTIPAGPVLLYTDISPLVSYTWIGVSFTITLVSLWSSIPHIVPPTSLGTANGIASCMLDLSVGLTSIAIGQIMSTSQSPDGLTTQSGWRYVFLTVFGHATICAISGLVLNMCCRKDKKVNEKTHLDREPSFGPIHCSPIPSPVPGPETGKPVQDVFTVWTDITDANKDIIIENNAAQEWRKFSKYKATLPKQKRESAKYKNSSTDIDLENNNTIATNIIIISDKHDTDIDMENEFNGKLSENGMDNRSEML